MRKTVKPQFEGPKVALENYGSQYIHCKSSCGSKSLRGFAVSIIREVYRTQRKKNLKKYILNARQKIGERLQNLLLWFHPFLLAVFFLVLALPAAVKRNVLERVFSEVRSIQKDRSGGVRSGVNSRDCERLLQRR